MSVGISWFGIGLLLGVCALVIATLRKPSWLTLLAIPFGLLLLLGVGTVAWSVAVPRHVSYVPDARVEAQNWQIEQAGSVMHNRDRSGPVSASVPPRWIIVVPLLLGVAACVTVLALNRKWIAQHANFVLPVLVLGLAGLLATGVAFLHDARMVSSEQLVREQHLQNLRMIGEALHRRSSEVSLPSADFNSHNVQDAAQQEEILTDAAYGGAVDTSVDSSKAVDSAEEAPASAPTPELPEWARGETVDWRELPEGVHQNPVVLKSDQWSSVQESEIQMEAMAARALEQQLRVPYGSSFNWEPSTDFIHQSGAIQQRFVEQTSLKVGEFETPMYRSYWQVAATPHVSDLAQKEWKAAAVQERLTMLGAGAAVLTLLFAGGAAGLRFDSATSGQYRRRLAAAAVAVGALAAGTAALFVA
jgi:hypothetical protein